MFTGREALVFGGSARPQCEPEYPCLTQRRPLVDGAAYDPANGRWRRIADAPVAFDAAQGVFASGMVYVWIPPSPEPPRSAAAFLSYDIARDRWTQLAVPSTRVSERIAAIAGTVIAYSSTDESGVFADRRYDATTGRWVALPADPLGRSFDRALVDADGRGVLLAHPLVAQPSSSEPSLVRAASLDPVSGRWTLLPDSKTLGEGAWLVADSLVVNPHLGTENGGASRRWPRAYPTGGLLDPTAGRWAALPPLARRPNVTDVGVGVVGRATAAYVDAPPDYELGARSWVYEVSRAAWMQVPAGPISGSPTVVAAGRDLFAFGGTEFRPDGRPFLTSRAAIWTPPPAVNATPDLVARFTNVAWTQTAASPTGDSTSYRKTGATVRLWCTPRPVFTINDEGAPSQHAAATASAACAALSRDPSFLRQRPPPCTQPAYWDGAVRIDGAWRGQSVALVLSTCKQDEPTNAAQRWAMLFGLAFVGPDPEP